MSGLIAIALIVMVLGVTAFCVFVERAQRRIPVDYAKSQVGRRMYAGQTTHLPFKLNMSGVIPPIFASSLLLFPATIAGFAGTNNDTWWGNALQTFGATFGYGQPAHITMYAVPDHLLLLLLYGAGVQRARDGRQPQEVGRLHPRHPPRSADRRIHRQGAHAAHAVGRGVHHRGLPAARAPGVEGGVPFVFGGTSLLIVVVVAMDFFSQLQAHLMSHHYPGLLKKANLMGYGRSGAPQSNFKDSNT